MRRFSTRVMLAVLLCLQANLHAATLYWTGGAQDVPQITTIAVTGTWSTSDTGSVTCNNKSVTVTIGTATSTSDVAAAMVAAINSDDKSTETNDLVGDESKNIGGQQIGEFKDFVATASGSTITLKSTTDGVPFNVNVSDTAASGALGSPTNSQEATGKNHFDDAKNWDQGSAPANGDTVVFPPGNISCLYGLDSSVTIAGFDRNRSYTGNIGLARTNATHSGKSYREYRTRHLKATPHTSGAVFRLGSGGGSTALSGRTNLNFGDQNPEVIVEAGPAAGSDGIKPIEFMTGAGVIDLTIYQGHVSLGAYGEKQCNFGATRVGVLDEEASAASLHINAAPSSASILLNSGMVTLEVALGGTMNIYGGTLTVESGAQATANLYGGTLVYNSTGTLTTVNNYSGQADFSQDSRSKTVTNTNIWDDGTSDTRHRDPHKVITYTNGIDLEDCAWEDIKVDLGPSQTWTPSSL